MIIYEFEDGTLVNLAAFEGLTIDGDKYHLVTISGTRYNISKEEFTKIKQMLQNSLKNSNNINAKNN